MFDRKRNLATRGAALAGGRWNPKGFPVLYTCANPSTAVLEVACMRPDSFRCATCISCR
ncbi:RES domain-containing protein [Paraburkholderia phosphatilytica]|uniref:RES domain-containing protein n=1 Tax=Paraburkholderia phosphatilytica TaxID=2282883 RepID=UPI0030B7F6C2